MKEAFVFSVFFFLTNTEFASQLFLVSVPPFASVQEAFLSLHLFLSLLIIQICSSY